MPELLYNLELTDIELSLLWALLASNDNEYRHGRHPEMVAAVESTLSKVEHLMVGK